MKLKKEEIWKDYKVYVGRHSKTDIHLNRWISIILKSLSEKTQEENKKLNDIVEGLRSPDTFKESIKDLSDYLKSNPGTSLEEYFPPLPKESCQTIINSLKECGIEIKLRSIEEKDLQSAKEESNSIQKGSSVADIMEKVNKYKALVQANVQRPTGSNN